MTALTRTFRAELARLTQARTVIGTTLAILLAGIGGAVIVLSNAAPAAAGPQGFLPSTEALARTDGGTEVFRTTVAFGGTLLFVLFVGVFALEFSRGTYRTMLLRQPRRVALLGGKLLALLVFAAVALAGMEALMWATARLLASSYDVDAGAWAGADAIGSALGDFGMVMVWVTGYAIFGMMIAVVLRSVPLALAVGVAWAGPFEHLLDDAWDPAGRYFPGLLLEAVGQGGEPGLTATRAAVSAALYALAFAGVTAAVFGRRDVTA